MANVRHSEVVECKDYRFEIEQAIQTHERDGYELISIASRPCDDQYNIKGKVFLHFRKVQ